MYQDMHQNMQQSIAKELSLAPHQVQAVAELLESGATVPFIARYRKEAHGSLDEVAIVNVRDRIVQLQALQERKTAILKSLTERELLTPELHTQVEHCATMAVLEDIYLPYKPKRRTRAMVAREKGLEPLALLLLEQQQTCVPATEAQQYISAELGVENVEDALAGAKDIIAEMVNEQSQLRAYVRDLFVQKGLFIAKKVKNKEDQGEKFKDYYDWVELAHKAAGHRVLALFRGEKEGILSLHLLPEAEDALAMCHGQFVINASAAAKEVEAAIADCYKRLLAPSMETEARQLFLERAEKEAITVFAQNLRGLLLASPLGQKRILAIDPGFRTGCKVVCLDPQGAFLYTDVIYLLTAAQQKEAQDVITKLCAKYQIEVVAIGNGTASRESESMVRALGLSIPVVMVSENGASVYSASEIARKEFPELDLTVRGAISIGRRLMDPLAELVKIDPKAIGVGQYQHDVNQTELKKTLDDVVGSCVNKVGVELNTASAALLTHVSGLGATLAKNIVDYREENGAFKYRKDLLKVPRLGPKAYEQAAGFLRIHNGKNILDSSAVHPESYRIVEQMAQDVGCSLDELVAKAELRKKIVTEKYVSAEFGLPTITDILAELEKPGRDPRQSFEFFAFNDTVKEIKDLEVGMRLPGIVTNVTNFGAFVDIGVHQDGLVHISQLADAFVKNPHDAVTVQQQVMVTVTEVDIARKRIALSMRSNPEETRSGPAHTGFVNTDSVNTGTAHNSGGSKHGQKPQTGHSKATPTQTGTPTTRQGQKPVAEPFNNPFANIKR